MVDSGCETNESTLNERPFPMRWRRADLRGRVNGNLELRFGRTGLTSYAGLEFVRRYFDALGLVRLVRRELAAVRPRIFAPRCSPSRRR